MLKRIDHVFCDKCKKEIKEREIVYHEFYTAYIYDLCDECYKQFKEFDNKVKRLKNKWEKLEKEYQFGEYLPKEKVGDE